MVEIAILLDAFFVALALCGFRALAPKKSGEHPLFWPVFNCTGTIEGPDVETFAGLSFFIFGLGLNSASTCCENALKQLFHYYHFHRK